MPFQMTEYIEYCEDEIKMEIKSEDDDFELSQTRKYSEYFEEDVKEEIIDEKNPDSILVKYKCDICSKSYKSKSNLTQHIQSSQASVSLQLITTTDTFLPLSWAVKVCRTLSNSLS